VGATHGTAADFDPALKGPNNPARDQTRYFFIKCYAVFDQKLPQLVFEGNLLVMRLVALMYSITASLSPCETVNAP